MPSKPARRRPPNKPGTAPTLAPLLALALLGHATGSAVAAPVSGPGEARAARIVDATTLDEQIQLLRPLAATSMQLAPGANTFPAAVRKPPPPGAQSSAGFVPAIPRLGWPALQESDGPLGVANMKGWIRGIDDQATALPASIAWAASFDPVLAERAGKVIGAEAHSKGFNVMLSGAVNLAREPRGGRTFEYAGEDPLLAGLIIGSNIAGIQSQHVVSTIKHFALNDQESGRGVLDARISEAGARESDLLAFEIAIDRGHPGSVMCSYNRVNGAQACENAWLLNTVLKGEWGFKGWVMSDWGGVHALAPAVQNGLDQQSPQDKDFFADLKAAVERREISRARVRDMALRIVGSLIRVGGLDQPARSGGRVDRTEHINVARQLAEEGAVLLKNDGLLPVSGRRRVLLVGGYADKGVLAGGGGSMVNPYGGIIHEDNAIGLAALSKRSFDPSPPLEALRRLHPEFEVSFDDGKDPARAAVAARAADVVIVFGLKTGTEAFDTPDLHLPGGQDALIETLAAANPHIAVVLETGNPVAMPWLGKVQAVLEAWFPGQAGGEAIARLLAGDVSPSGRLPLTFPRDDAQLPRRAIDGLDPKATLFSPQPAPFAVDYEEGSDVGYRWFEKSKAEPLFPFGFGLTYGAFEYTDLKVVSARKGRISFVVRNTGRRPAVDVPQLYVAPPGRTHRLAAWTRVALKAGEHRRITLEADPRLLLSYEGAGWRRAGGVYDLWVSPSARLSGLHKTIRLASGFERAQRP